MHTLFVFLFQIFLAKAAFVVLSPEDYRDNFIEGWPGPHGDGSGVGVVNQSSYEWAVENLPLFESSDEDLYAIRFLQFLCLYRYLYGPY